MRGPTAWTLTPGFPQLAFGGLVVSFQRFALPRTGLIEGELPGSLGALPVAVLGRRFLLPVDVGEAFWIGVSLEAGAAVRLHLTPMPAEGRAVDERFLVPPMRAIPGWRRESAPGLLAFTREAGAAAVSLSELRLVVEAADHPPEGTTVELVDYPTYAARSGQPVPDKLDPDAGYKGYLLP